MEFPTLWKYLWPLIVYATGSSTNSKILLKSELKLHHKNEVRKKTQYRKLSEQLFPKRLSLSYLIFTTCMNVHIKNANNTQNRHQNWDHIQSQQKYRLGTVSNIKHVSFAVIKQRDRALKNTHVHVHVPMQNYAKMMFTLLNK